MSIPPLALVAQNASKRFKDKVVLNELSWQAQPGRVIGLLGRNGAGKTTFMECALGLRDLTSGSITVMGSPSHDLTDAARADIGFVPQSSDLFEWLTPRQLLDFVKTFYPRWNTQKADGLMQRWAIAPDTRISKLSGGERQRLSIIRALAHEPKLLMLDEPVAALDPAGRRDFLRELADGVIERETTVIFSTHILSDLQRVAVDVAFMRDGKISLAQPLDDLMERMRRLVGPKRLLDSLALGQIFGSAVEPAAKGAGRDADRATVIAYLTTAELENIERVSAIRCESLSLEDAFLEIA